MNSCFLPLSFVSKVSIFYFVSGLLFLTVKVVSFWQNKLFSSFNNLNYMNNVFSWRNFHLYSNIHPLNEMRRIYFKGSEEKHAYFYKGLILQELLF